MHTFLYVYIQLRESLLCSLCFNIEEELTHLLFILLDRVVTWPVSVWMATATQWDHPQIK